MGEAERASWLRFAKDDLEAARYLTGMTQRKLEIICYHCQQCAEKSLKSIYASIDAEIPRTHDFRLLVSNLRSAVDFSTFSAEFALLQPFAITVRYPYQMELEAGDEELALKAAERILEVCESSSNCRP